MCDYTGSHFGAAYDDACCIDGELWDLDSCDEAGLLYSGGNDPCPRCATKAWLDRAADEAKEGGSGVTMFTPYNAMIVWEHAIAVARNANPDEAEALLAGMKPFETDDWPDRQAVYGGQARWDDVVARMWKYQPLNNPQ